MNNSLTDIVCYDPKLSRTIIIARFSVGVKYSTNEKIGEVAADATRLVYCFPQIGF